MSLAVPKKVWNAAPPPVGGEYHSAFGVTLGLKKPTSERPSPLKSALVLRVSPSAVTSIAPTSQAVPFGRVVPIWSTPRPHAVLSIAALPDCGA